jgi:uncharacterized protein (DUF2235 family)
MAHPAHGRTAARPHGRTAAADITPPSYGSFARSRPATSSRTVRPPTDPSGAPLLVADVIIRVWAGGGDGADQADRGVGANGLQGGTMDEARDPINIVVCCDGTWNTPDEHHGPAAKPTNVAKLALSVAVGSDQLFFYEPGVGTSPDERIAGGAFGLGLSQNIRNAYQFLADTYRDGDRIFLFGFSRGAYTARSLAGLIHNCGILRHEHRDRVDEAFAFYRDRTSHTRPSALASQIFRREYAHAQDTIHFIGVWDTVGALGIPDDLPGWKEFGCDVVDWQELWGFHDTQLGPHVTCARHALAIDEQRLPFKPTLWTAINPDAKNQSVKQVWFAGVHTEVGGGAADSSLSDIALLWMLGEAVAEGLRIEPARLTPGGSDGAGQAVAPNYAAPLMNSRTGAWELLHPYHRLQHLLEAARSAPRPPGQSLASSAQRRFGDRQLRYSPQAFADYFTGLPETQVTDSTPADAANG